jgi:hypothetical protein
VGSDFTKEDCTPGCDNELIVSSDCKEAFYCLSRFTDGGRHIKCEDNNQVTISDQHSLIAMNLRNIYVRLIISRINLALKPIYTKFDKKAHK